MAIRNKKLNALLELLSKEGPLTLVQIMDKLSIKERMAKTYIKDLRVNGIEVICEEGKYSVSQEESIKGEFLSSRHLNYIYIMTIVSKYEGELSLQQLEKKAQDYLWDNTGDVAKSTNIKAMIKFLMNNNYIYLDRNNMFRLSTDKTFLNFLDIEEVYLFLDYFSIFKNYLPFNAAAGDIYDKLVKNLNFEESSEAAYCLGREYKLSSISKDIIEELEELNYMNYKIVVEYNSRLGVISSKLGIITLLYSWEKDKGYLVGFDGENIVMIITSNIISIKSAEERNEYYRDKALLLKVNAMFDAAYDGVYEAEVHFDNINNIYEKLQRLQRMRKNSTVTKIGDKIVYKDAVSGLYDFARYLRRFGSSCVVTQPPELKKIMLDSYERSLQRYMEVAADERA